LDLDDPERVAHFHPTSKSIQIVRAIVGLESDRAFISTASYGSGKSIAALFSAIAIENRSETLEILNQIRERLEEIDSQTADFIQQRTASGQPGLILAFDGHSKDFVADLRQAVKEGFARINQPLSGKYRRLGNLRSLGSILNFTVEECLDRGIDRIAIIWDEFGRHLEGLIASGRAQELSRLQQLAEIVARLELPATLTLLLHQNFFQYAGSLNQTARSEWKKIEGRFQAISYVDDSREMTDLIATFVEALRGDNMFIGDRSKDVGQRHLKADFFNTFENEKQLANILAKAYPLDPAVLATLPRLAGRIAQNERTVFDFIRSVDLTCPVRLDTLYDYFSPLMRADTGFGGTFKAWLETESALAKVKSDLEETILKSTCLLGIGQSGQRVSCQPENLAAAVSGWRTDSVDIIETTIRDLIDRKLLLYRRHANEVSVWHGADIDLRGRLEEEKQRASSEFDLEEFLTKAYPPPVWKPLTYNSRFAIRRYFPGQYVDAETILKQEFDGPVWQIPNKQDGIVLYVITRNAQEISNLKKKAKSMPDRPGFILAIPSASINVYEPALELFCLLRMQRDTQMIGEDPMVLPELKQMADDACKYLDRLMGRICQPGSEGPLWYDSGNEIPASDLACFRNALSDVTERRFPMTPVIQSEAVVRNQLSRPMVNARKKVLAGIIERSGTEDLGLTGTTPDASMYRTVLKHTGLYRPDTQGLWGWASLREIDDDNLREVWEVLHRFFTDPKEGKSPEKLFEQFSAPPYGLRQGVIPILFAAAYRAFPSLHALYRGNEYLPDILPGTIEDLCLHPERYHLDVFPLEKGRKIYLQQVTQIFGGEEDPIETDLIRSAYDALCWWRNQLPEVAWNSTRISGTTKRFRVLIKKFQDPVQLLFDDLPKLAAIVSETGDYSAVIDWLYQWKESLEKAGLAYEDEALSKMRQNLSARGAKTATEWAMRIPDAVSGYLDPKDLACLKRLSDTTLSEREQVRSLATIFVGDVPENWRDSTAREFDSKLTETLTRIEDRAVDLGGESAQVILESRLKCVYERLYEALGPEQARSTIERLLRHEENHHGDLRRSAS